MKLTGITNKGVHLSLMTVLVFALGSPAFAVTRAPPHTIYVGTCQVNGTSTIQAAVDGVKSGGLVLVCPGSYPEQVIITQPLTLSGVISGTMNAAVIIPPSGGMVNNGTDINGNAVQAQLTVKNTTGVVIKDMTVDGTGNNISGCVPSTFEGIYYENASGTIEFNVVRNQYQTDYATNGGCQSGLAINVESVTTSNTVTINNNSVSAYQKNGITASGTGTGTGAPGPDVILTNNRIVGLGATGMAWPSTGAAENGIQVSYGATATITLNTVNNNIWAQDQFGDTEDAASGILIYASQGVTISRNNVNSAQYGIVTVSDPNAGSADGTDITTNEVTGTQLYDAIDLCSNNNTAKSNTVYGNAESGIHLDDTCGGTGGGNTATGNVINEACAGILLGTGTNTSSPNVYYNVVNTTVAADTCTSPTYGPAHGAAKASRARPSPYIMKRKQ